MDVGHIEQFEERLIRDTHSIAEAIGKIEESTPVRVHALGREEKGKLVRLYGRSGAVLKCETPMGDHANSIEVSHKLIDLSHLVVVDAVVGRAFHAEIKNP